MALAIRSISTVAQVRHGENWLKSFSRSSLLAAVILPVAAFVLGFFVYG
jgi:hypothetical protein